MPSYRTILFNTLASIAIATVIAPGLAVGQEPARPWMNASLSPDARADLLVNAMTLDEKLALVHGPMAMTIFGIKKPDGAIGSAGYFAPNNRLGIPAIEESDASLGVTNPLNARPGDRATAMPSGLALAATFNSDLAYKGGALIGTEAHAKGFNVQLAGGVNLARDPRNGRNFEYLGEDPWLAGTLAGESIRGIQSQHVVSTVKHFAVNDQETGRNFANSLIDDAAMRESDLLAFQIAIEKGQPGSVMCAYNLVNSVYACGNDYLLNTVLKGDWGYKGWVMSDWGAVKATDFALKGLDQQSGEQLDAQVWFGAPLKAAIETNKIPATRLADMTHRILRSMFAVGAFDKPAKPGGAIDFDGHADIAKSEASEAIVLLKNTNNLLPLTSSVKSILVIGGYADAGVLSGGGSSQVVLPGQAVVPLGGEGMMAAFRNMNLHPSSPLKALRAGAPDTKITFYDGRYSEEAARLAKAADVVIVFGLQWMGEGEDAPNLSLPYGQDEMIKAVTEANSKTIVVLETGGPVAMPWLDKAGAVLEAWYAGQKGGEAIADVLLGKTNPSGHLPMTFPASLDQYPRVEMPGRDVPEGQVFDVHYDEGADIGYRRFAKTGAKPLFPFGYGQSYTKFDYSDLKIIGGTAVTVSFKVTNTGKAAGKDAPQVYLTGTPSKTVQRLIGFNKVDLAPGESKVVTLAVDSRLLAHFDPVSKRWVVADGSYGVAVAHAADDLVIKGQVKVKAQTMKP